MRRIRNRRFMSCGLLIAPLPFILIGCLCGDWEWASWGTVSTGEKLRFIGFISMYVLAFLIYLRER